MVGGKMKGVLLSGLMVIVIIVIFAVIIESREEISGEVYSLSLRQELKDMDNSYGSIERSLHTISDVSAKRGLIIAVNHLLTEGVYFENTSSEILLPLIYNGTDTGGFGDKMEMMDNNSIDYNLRLLEYHYSLEPRRYDVSIGLGIENISIEPYDPYSIIIRGLAEVNISKPGVAKASRIIPIEERVSIIGFEDPLFLLNVSRGKHSRGIFRPPFGDSLAQKAGLEMDDGAGHCYGYLEDDSWAENPGAKILAVESLPLSAENFCGAVYYEGDAPGVSYIKAQNPESLDSHIGEKMLLLASRGDVYNISNLILLLEWGYYIPSDSGPSFFDRLEGNMECSYCGEYGKVGLESLVDKNAILGLDIMPCLDCSNIDFEYAKNTAGLRIGVNQSSAGPPFYEFRLDNSAIGRIFG
jgi:hypothetical protein